MHLLFTDETNLKSSASARFFAYGGLVVDAAHSLSLSSRIAAIRAAHGYLPPDELKFDTRSRPAHVTQDQAKQAKRAVVQACIEEQCKFIVSVTLHDIAKNQTPAALVEQGANSVIAKYNQYLGQHGSHGVVIVDRLPNAAEYKYLSDRFSLGLPMQGGTRQPLDRVVLLASSCSGASHCASAMDIVLGSFRFCINSPKNRAAAAEMMAAVTKLIWHERRGEDILAHERGLLFRPRTVKVAAYKEQYDQLLGDINSLLALAEKESQPEAT